MARKIRAAKG